MSNYPPQGGYQGGGYQGGGYPPSGGYQGGGYPPPPSSSGKTQVLSLDYNVAALLCYLPICCISLIASLMWLFTEPKQNRFLRFHALQSLLLTGAAIVVGMVFWFLGFGVAVTGSDIGGLVGLLLTLVQLALYAVFVVLFIIGMVKGYQGQMWKMPLIGDIAEKNT